MWNEFNYDTRLLHSNLAFPLLRKLTELGDFRAKKVFKEEIAKRVTTGYNPIIQFLTSEGYLEFLNFEELEVAFGNLKIIDLSECNLEEFPTFVLKSKNLKKLILID